MKEEGSVYPMRVFIKLSIQQRTFWRCLIKVIYVKNQALSTSEVIIMSLLAVLDL